MKQVTSSLVHRYGVVGVAFLISTLGASQVVGQPGPTTAAPVAAPVQAPAAQGVAVEPSPSPAVAPVAGVAPAGTNAGTNVVPAVPGDAGVAGQQSAPGVPATAATSPTAPQPPPVAVATPYGARLSEPRVIATPVAAPDPSAQTPPKTHYPVALFLDISPLWQTSRGYDLFSSNDVSTRAGLTAEVDLVEVSEKAFLSVDLGGSVENASDTVLGGELQADLSVASAAAGLRLRQEFCPVFGAHVAALGGASRVRTSFNHGTETKQWLPTAQLGAGVTAMLPGTAKVRPGLLAEGGYFLSESTDLTLKSAADEGTLTRVNTDLGTLSRSGPYLRFSIFARY